MTRDECHECESQIVVPFYDDEEVFWCGKRWARVWCSSECHKKSAERYWVARQCR